jgi:hypothetical protein
LKSYKLPCTDQIPAELIQLRCRIVNSEINELINYILNKEELSQQWKESIIVHIYKKGDKTDCSIYQGISLSSTSCKILSNILFSRLSPHTEGIIEDHQCGF